MRGQPGRRAAVAIFLCVVGATAMAGQAPAPLRDIVQVSAGGAHICAVTTRGGVLCWGENSAGQLGDGTSTRRTLPVAVVGLGGAAAQVSAGSEYTCARLVDGRVRCWGLNYDGQIGNGVGGFGTVQPVPTDAIGIAGAIALDAGNEHTCVLLAGGSARCWGRNNHGQLGDGTTTDRFTPGAVAGFAGGVEIRAGDGETIGFTCARTAGGAVQCWGSNFRGQLGDGGAMDRGTPQNVTGFAGGALSMDAGGDHACALTASGARCWGGNGWGHLGSLGFGEPYSATPRDVTGLAGGASALGVYDELSCALMNTQRVQCWGVTRFVVGNVQPEFTLTPVDQGFANAVSLSVGGAGFTLESNVCVVTTSGGVQCKGGNSRGQLGRGATGTYQDAPGDVLAGPDVFADGFEN